MKQKTIHDTGASQPTRLSLEINDGDYPYMTTPRSAYAFNVPIDFVGTNRIAKKAGERLNIADGAVRPGWAE